MRTRSARIDVLKIAALLLVGACACMDDGPTRTGEDLTVEEIPAGVEYTAIRRGEEALNPRVSLCELLAAHHAGAGMFRILRLVGVTEEGDRGPFGVTYVEAELADGWLSGTPARAVFRISGGPAGGDLTEVWNVNLAVGEVVGILLDERSSENRGYRPLEPLALFSLRGAGLTNEQLFTQTPITDVALGELVAANWPTCTADVMPDNRPPHVEAPPPPFSVSPPVLRTARPR